MSGQSNGTVVRVAPPIVTSIKEILQHNGLLPREADLPTWEAVEQWQQQICREMPEHPIVSWFTNRPGLKYGLAVVTVNFFLIATGWEGMEQLWYWLCGVILLVVTAAVFCLPHVTVEEVDDSFNTFIWHVYIIDREQTTAWRQAISEINCLPRVVFANLRIKVWTRRRRLIWFTIKQKAACVIYTELTNRQGSTRKQENILLQAWLLD